MWGFRSLVSLRAIPIVNLVHGESFVSVSVRQECATRIPNRDRQDSLFADCLLILAKEGEKALGQPRFTKYKDHLLLKNPLLDHSSRKRTKKDQLLTPYVYHCFQGPTLRESLIQWVKGHSPKFALQKVQRALEKRSRVLLFL